MESLFDKNEFHMSYRGRGLERTQQTSWLLSCHHRYLIMKSMNASRLTFSLFWWNVAFLGPSRSAKGRRWGEAAVRVVAACRSLCSPAQRASSHLTAVLLMSCRARETVSRTSWSFWYTAITFTDLPSTHIKMKFPLTGEHRSQKEVKVFMFVFPFGCYFGSPLLPVLI